MVDIQKSKTFITGYYFALAIVMIALVGRGDSLLPNALRIAFMILTIIPVLFHREYLSWVITMFLGVSLVSFSPIFPTDQLYYFPVLVALSLFAIYQKSDVSYCWHRRTVLTIFALFCVFGMLHLEIPHYVAPTILSILLMLSINEEYDVLFLLESIVYASLILSVMFLLYRNQFAVDYGGSMIDVQRTGWINPNVYGLFVAGGSVLSTAALLKQIPYRKTVITDILFYAASILGGAVLCLNASRGALLSWVVCVALFVLTANLKIRYKIMFSIILILVAYWMYIRGSLGLLIYRMQEDTLETGGGRTDIWQMKLEAFSTNSSPFEWLLGIGKSGCDNLVGTISTHNDVLTALIAFGIVGFICYAVFLFYPIKTAQYHNKKAIGILTLFLIIESFTQEPVFRGELCFLIFYLSVFFLSQMPGLDEN